MAGVQLAIIPFFLTRFVGLLTYSLPWEQLILNCHDLRISSPLGVFKTTVWSPGGSTMIPLIESPVLVITNGMVYIAYKEMALSYPMLIV